MHKMEVSIVVPVYNSQRYLSRCIESIRNQTYKNLEIVLIDDGSTDASGEICDQYACLDQRIHVIHKINEGAGMARNYGIEIACGKYIAFVDSDDYIAPFFVENMLDYAVENECDIVQCSYISGMDEQYPFHDKKSGIKTYDHQEVFYGRNAKIIVPGKLYLLSLFSNIKYPCLSEYDDEFITYKLLYEAKKIGITKDIYYYYYQSDNSIMRTKRSYYSEDFIQAYNERIVFFREKNEEELVYISYKEKCISLMLFYIKCKLDKKNENDKKQLIQLYKKDYKVAILARHLSFKENFALRVFRYYPNIIVLGKKIFSKK